MEEIGSDLPLLPSGWIYRELGDLLQPEGLSYGVVQPGVEDNDGVPLIRVKNLRGGRILADDVIKISHAVEEKYQRTRLRGGEVLLSLVGSVGATAVVPPELAGWNIARAIAVIRPSAEVSSEWLKLCLASELAQFYMSAWQTNTVQATLNLRDVRRLPMIMPPEARRTAIIHLIGALDDKIAVNDRIATTARDLGLALFMQAAATDRAGESEIGSLAELVSRGVAPKYSEDESELMVLNQRCVRDGRVTLVPARRTLAAKVSSAKRLKTNDVLVNSTGVGTLGRVARWTGNQEATVDSHVTIVRFDISKVDPLWGGFAMLAAQPAIERLGEGSTGQTELSRTKLGSLPLRVPSRDIQNSLTKQLTELESRGEAALVESQVLAELRDALLPGLMSGAIRVRDAEKAVEAVI